MRKCTSLFYIFSKIALHSKAISYLRVDSTPLAQLCLGNRKLLLHIKNLFIDIWVFFFFKFSEQDGPITVSANSILLAIIFHCSAQCDDNRRNQNTKAKIFHL